MKKTLSNKRFLVLGATGFIGSHLISKLRSDGLAVRGTSRRKKTGLFSLDTSKDESVAKFPWRRFDIIVDCTGNIDYSPGIQSLTTNLETNVMGPLKIVSKLNANQSYYYLSSHSVLLSSERQNSYSASKLMFEGLCRSFRFEPKITILRIPAVYSNDRKNGLVYNIKTAFIDKKPFKFAFKGEKWHTMFMDRLVDLVSKIMTANRKDDLITVGYPISCDIKSILRTAEKELGKAPISLKSSSSDNYRPDIKRMLKYYKIKSADFTRDLTYYFNQ